MKGNHPNSLVQKVINSGKDSISWPVNFAQYDDKKKRGNKMKLVSAKRGTAIQETIQNTKRQTELGRVNRTNDDQAEENSIKIKKN